jgi:TRAP-type C4-dicarboxylate transport system substrate-binding protein
VVTALQTGMVDGFYIPPSGAVGLQWFTKVKYMTLPKLNNLAGGVLITQKKWQSLPPGQQQVVREISNHLGKNLTRVARKDNQEALAILKQSGIQTVEMDEAGKKLFFDLSHQVRRELIGKLYDEKILNLVETYIKEYRNSKKT